MNTVQAAHVRALRGLATRVHDAPDLRSAAALIEQWAAEMFGAATALVRTPAPHRRRTDLTTDGDAVGGADSVTAFNDLDEHVAELTPASAGPERSDAAAAVPIDLGRHGGAQWTLSIPEALNNSSTRAFITRIRRSLGTALVTPAWRERATRTNEVLSKAFAFSRDLAGLAAPGLLPQFIVDRMAAAIGARLGAIALADRPGDRLYIGATHGYPMVLVEHVRLSAGEGILGGVFESKRPLLVRDVRRLQGHQPRGRYRTDSFLAVPLVGNRAVVGVTAFTDREDDQPFDETDVATVGTLGGSAIIALQRDALAREAQELAHAASIDPLTGLFNRRHFQIRIDEEIERARRHSLSLSLLLIDIDDFKRINDTLGHLAGDRLLKQVADVLKRSVRMFDVCTRFGGEEFAILMPGSADRNALVVAERIRSRIELASREDVLLPPDICMTASLGLAVLAEDASPSDLIARADRALYRAKAEGKNRIHVD